MNNYKYNPIKMTPFKWFVLENFPFIEEDFDSLTSYGLWCKLKEYFEKVATKTNEMGTQVESLTNAFIALKNYVDNYFKNLDVQDEINNKLDEMVESGILQEIITQYLNTKAFFGFNTINDLKQATNLIDGSYAKTLGFYEKNDLGGAEYFIRNKTVNDVENNGTIHFLTNNLVAELVNKNTFNPEIFGAYGDGNNNDTNALNLMFNANCQNFINNKYYKFTNISINNKETIKISGGKFEGHLNFSNCNKVVLENIEFLSGNNNFDEIINFLNCKKIVIKNCKFNGKLIKETTKGVKVVNTTDFECVNSNFDNFDGKTDVDILPNGNSAGQNTRNQTTGIFLQEVTNILVNKCNFYNILGRSGVYIENCSNIEISSNNFNFIYGSGVHIGNYYKIININNNYFKQCAITGVSSSDFLYLNGGKDGAIDVYGAEDYFSFLANDSSIEINNNYFYGCGTREGFSTDYYVYTDTTKTTLATHYSNGNPIGSQPLNVSTRLQCIRLLNSYKANIHDNLIVHPYNRVLQTNSRQKYSASGNNYTFTNNNFLKVNSNKVILNDFADFYLSGVRSIDFSNNTIEAFSNGSDYISTSQRSEDFNNTKFLVSLINATYSIVKNNFILSDVFSGIYNQIGSHSEVAGNAIQVWSFGIYIPLFVSLILKNNICWVGRKVQYTNPTEESGLDSGGIYVNQSKTMQTICTLSDNISPIITNVVTNLFNKSNVNGNNHDNYSSNSGNIFAFNSANKIFKINLPIDDKYYIEYANGTRKEFDFS